MTLPPETRASRATWLWFSRFPCSHGQILSCSTLGTPAQRPLSAVRPTRARPRFGHNRHSGPATDTAWHARPRGAVDGGGPAIKRGWWRSLTWRGLPAWLWQPRVRAPPSDPPARTRGLPGSCRCQLVGLVSPCSHGRILSCSNIKLFQSPKGLPFDGRTRQLSGTVNQRIRWFLLSKLGKGSDEYSGTKARAVLIQVAAEEAHHLLRRLLVSSGELGPTASGDSQGRMAPGRALPSSGLHRHQHVGWPRGGSAFLQWQRYCRAVDKEGKYALNWFVANQVRLALFILAYNRTCCAGYVPRTVKHWSLRSLQALNLSRPGGGCTATFVANQVGWLCSS